LACRLGENAVVEKILQWIGSEFNNEQMSREMIHEALATALMYRHFNVVANLINHCLHAKVNLDFSLSPLFIDALNLSVINDDSKSLQVFKLLFSPMQAAEYWKTLLKNPFDTLGDKITTLLKAEFAPQFLYFLNEEEFNKLISFLEEHHLGIPVCYLNATNPQENSPDLLNIVLKNNWTRASMFILSKRLNQNL